MSGGTFNYAQRWIDHIVDEVEEKLKMQGQPVKGVYWMGDFDGLFKQVEHHEIFTPEVEEKMREGIKVLKTASVYAQRIDWFLAGDDGEAEFLERLKEDLDKI